MKKRKYIIIEILYITVLLLGVIACTEDTEAIETYDGEGIFRFSATESIYTRTTNPEETFTVGTKFQLYAINNNRWNENLLSKTGGGDAVIGTENEAHIITYDGSNKFNNKELNFYGVTASNEDVLPLNTTGAIPVIAVKYPNSGSLPDILWTQKLKQTYNQSGTIQLSFIHTLSKLNLQVQKHTDVTKSLAITKIEFCDYASGNLDISTGEFKSSEETRENNFYTVFTGSQVLSTTTAPLTDSNGKKVEPTIFPTRSNEITDMAKHSLGIKITMSNGNSYTYWTKEIALDDNNQPIKKNGKEQYKPFQFKPNYEYDVQLTVTESAMVVTILPRVYDWIPKEEGQTGTDIGNPVTFGGVTWMDRNLGAASADPTASEMDWEKSRGFYYQFGRSIPYYLKGSMQDPSYENLPQMHTPVSNGDSKSNAKPFPYVYGHYEDAQYSFVTSHNDYKANLLAKKPSDITLKYNFVFQTKDEGSTYRDWDQDHTTSAQGWSTEAKQPCPKGWRLPTKDEFLTIYPTTANAGDITFRHHSGTVYRETPNNEVYVGTKSRDAKYGTIYAIKNKGTNSAYRLRWHVEEVGTSNCSSNPAQKRSVVVISRYPATSKNDLTITNSADNNYYMKYDWDHPTEVLKLPIAGYIHCDSNGAALIYAGVEAIYWTSDAYTASNTAYSIRIKIAGSDADREMKYWNLERRGYGCLIRCVRDNSVKE